MKQHGAAVAVHVRFRWCPVRGGVQRPFAAARLRQLDHVQLLGLEDID